MELLYLIKVSFEKSFKELIRYKFEMISMVAGLYFLFIAMFYGAKTFGTGIGANPLTLDSTLEGFVAGYFLWTIMLMIFFDTSQGVISDANKGTLEQISMSGLGMKKVLIVKSLSNLVINVAMCFIVLFTIMATTGYWLNMQVGQLIIILLLGSFSMIGLSMVFGGLALIFKRIQSFLNIMQYLLIALVLPGNNAFATWVAALIPFRPTIELFYRVALGNQNLLDFTAMEYGVVILNSVIYFGIGLLVFDLCSRKAKRSGLLGQY